MPFPDLELDNLLQWDDERSVGRVFEEIKGFIVIAEGTVPSGEKRLFSVAPPPLFVDFGTQIVSSPLLRVHRGSSPALLSTPGIVRRSFSGIVSPSAPFP